MLEGLEHTLRVDLQTPPYSWPIPAGTDTGLVTDVRVYKEANLPSFTRYAIIISPGTQPWTERRIAVPQIEYIHSADLYLLVKNFHETNSLIGTTHPNRGLFQLVADVKEILRISTLGGLVTASNKTYDEPAGSGGNLQFHHFTGGFDTGEKSFVHRVKLQYVANMTPFCHPRL
jgi:hypothetical protein